MGRRRSASPRRRLTQHAVKNGRGRTVTLLAKSIDSEALTTNTDHGRSDGVCGQKPRARRMLARRSLRRGLLVALRRVAVHFDGSSPLCARLVKGGGYQLSHGCYALSFGAAKSILRTGYFEPAIFHRFKALRIGECFKDGEGFQVIEVSDSQRRRDLERAVSQYKVRISRSRCRRYEASVIKFPFRHGDTSRNRCFTGSKPCE
ncbi:hypothetical protein P3T20_003440 [Paraburkholderia sp. GAS206C]|uniref:Uncharacterized protein n=1 Tax=Paraburkholderia phenazinium TaxID=60549 RepID=A0A1N6JRA7_9BURK|nr:hypothetical protein SAMN05444168_4844 [Paraburkholderia phenazinium]